MFSASLQFPIGATRIGPFGFRRQPLLPLLTTSLLNTLCGSSSSLCDAIGHKCIRIRPVHLQNQGFHLAAQILTSRRSEKEQTRAIRKAIAMKSSVATMHRATKELGELDAGSTPIGSLLSHMLEQIRNDIFVVLF